MFEYIKKFYGVSPFIGQKVKVYGKKGIIVAGRGSYIGVNFDEDKPGLIKNCHPTDGVEYFDEGKIRKMTKSQENYQKYLRSESNLTFPEWMNFPRGE